MPADQKASDEEIVSMYDLHGTLSGAADALRMNRSSVHERLVKIGKNRKINLFTLDDEERLANEYKVFADAGRLGVLAESMGRTKHFLCRKARALGLTDPQRERRYLRRWEGIDAATARVIFDRFRRSKKSIKTFAQRLGYCPAGLASLFRFHFEAEYEAYAEVAKTKGGHRYRAGAKFENEVRDVLEGLGAFAMRSPQSKGLADVMAILNGEALIVQCKIGDWHSVDEWNAFLDLAERIGATPIYATRHGAGGAMKLYRMVQRKDGSRRPIKSPEWAPSPLSKTHTQRRRSDTHAG